LTYILPLTVWVYLHSNFSGGLRKMIFFPQECVLAVQGRHPKSLILVPVESACDFLLVRRRNLGPILHCFRDIAGFCAHDPTPIPP